mmetsp:Transcript_10159/g.11655  ORF Transcript_10159/g.11655 Transcript_10159/m.11655 type:complete len:187 (-) Transcript_10159:177-737(-)
MTDPLEDEVPCIDLYDETSIKRTLDEQTCKILEELGYAEDFFWSNIKLMLMVLACCAGLTAQFYPLPFPESTPVVTVCCAVYGCVMVLLQLIAWIVEKDYIMFGNYQNESKDSITINKLKVKSTFPSFQEIYTLTFEVYDGKNKKVDSSELKSSVGAYFSESGEFDRHTLKADLQKALKRLKSKQS